MATKLRIILCCTRMPMAAIAIVPDHSIRGEGLTARPGDTAGIGTAVGATEQAVAGEMPVTGILASVTPGMSLGTSGTAGIFIRPGTSADATVTGAMVVIDNVLADATTENAFGDMTLLRRPRSVSRCRSTFAGYRFQ